MPISGAYRAKSFSLAAAFAILLEGCGAGMETGAHSDLCYFTYVISRSGWPEFTSTMFRSADSAGQRLDVYISLKESRLKFERAAQGYQASYSADVRLQRADGTSYSKEVQRELRRKSYPTASDSSYDAFLLSFRVTPGEYNIDVTVTDQGSGEKDSHVYKKNIPEMSGAPMYMSDVMLLARADSSERVRRITPFILSNAGLLSDSLRCFSLLSSAESGTDTVTLTLYMLKIRAVPFNTFTGMLFSSTGSTLDPCRHSVDTVLVYRRSYPVAAESGGAHVFGVLPKPPVGNYILSVSVADSQRKVVSSSLLFKVRGKSFPDVSDNLSEKIASLGYIATKGELDKIISANGDSAVKSALLRFWSDNGGYAKMAEYYQRVSQANRFFSTCLEGWQTPMGMFYVICGAPDYVECRGPMYERWTYIKPSTQQQLIVDFRLNGEPTDPGERYYGLENVYSNVDFWSQYINRWRSPY